MGKVLIQSYTTKDPITLMGIEAGVCWNADVENEEKNYKRGIECVRSGHGRVAEFPQIYMVLDGYSAKVIREFYTHIGGCPTRLQASTRYIDYEHGFDYVTPYTIKRADEDTQQAWHDAMAFSAAAMEKLIEAGAPKEDAANLLPLAMETKVVVRTNLRNLIDMSHQRLCSRAYWEFRLLFNDIKNALEQYSPQWETIVSEFFRPKCEYLKYCPEKQSCGHILRKK